MEGISIAHLADAFSVDLERQIVEGSMDRFTAPLTGLTDLLLEQSSDVVEMVQNGDLLPVLTLWSSRPQAFADVPAVTELAPGFQPLVRMRGLAAHPEVPANRLAFMRSALLEAFNSTDYQAFLAANALDLVAYPTDPVAAFQAQVQIYQDFYCTELGVGCSD
jgi:tripartite-type tricarboxylate transporter receptor subunit TctC